MDAIFPGDPIDYAKQKDLVMSRIDEASDAYWDVVMRVNTTLKESLASPRLKDVLVNAGADAAGGSPEEFTRFFQNEIVKWGNVVKAAGITGG